MLDEGAKVVADVAKCDPRTPWSRACEESRYDVSAAVPNQEETCYFLTLKKPEISLVNAKNGKKLTVSYSGDTLPHFIEWKSMASGDYAVGLEPCTTELDDRFAYQTVKAQEQISFSATITVSSR